MIQSMHQKENPMAFTRRTGSKNIYDNPHTNIVLRRLYFLNCKYYVFVKVINMHQSSRLPWLQKNIINPPRIHCGIKCSFVIHKKMQTFFLIAFLKKLSFIRDYCTVLETTQ